MVKTRITPAFTPVLKHGRVRPCSKYKRKHPEIKSLAGQMITGYTKDMINIAKYELEYNPNDKCFYIRAAEEVVCSICGCKKMKRKGRRKRSVIMPNGEIKVLKIRRLKCKCCEKIHHELPDIIVPYKRHSAKTIEKIINGADEAIYCEESTLNRIKAWWLTIKLYIESVKASLEFKYGITFSSESKLLEIVRALVNRHLWPGTRSAWESK